MLVISMNKILVTLTLNWCRYLKYFIFPDTKITLDKNALFIKNPTEKDSGNFTCEAKNKYGYATKNFEAKISGK